MTAQDYGKIIVKRKWLALLVGLLFTIFWIGGLSGLSMNPDNRIFFSKERGIFLNTTYRLHPNINNYISENFYDGRLITNTKNQNSIEKSILDKIKK